MFILTLVKFLITVILIGSGLLCSWIGFVSFMGFETPLIKRINRMAIPRRFDGLAEAWCGAEHKRVDFAIVTTLLVNLTTWAILSLFVAFGY